MKKLEGKKIITIEEFKNCDIYDTTIGEGSITYEDHYILEAIYSATNAMEQISAYKLFKVFDKLEEDIANSLKYAACKFVLHLLRSGLETKSNGGSSSLGSMSYSTNPNDENYVPNDVIVAMERAGLLADNISGKIATPANYNVGRFGWDIYPDLYPPKNDEIVTRLKGNKWYVGYDRVESSDGSVMASITGTIDKPKLNLTVDLIAGGVEKLVNTTLNKWIPGLKITIRDDVYNMIINNEGLIETIEKMVEKLLEDQDEFITTMTNSIINLIIKNKEYQKELAEILKEPIIDTLKADIALLVKETFIESSKTTAIDTLDNKSLVDTILQLQKEMEQIKTDLEAEIANINVEDKIKPFIDAICPVGSIIAVDVGTKMDEKYWEKFDVPDGWTLIKGTLKGDSKIGHQLVLPNWTQIIHFNPSYSHSPGNNENQRNDYAQIGTRNGNALPILATGGATGDWVQVDLNVYIDPIVGWSIDKYNNTPSGMCVEYYRRKEVK